MEILVIGGTGTVGSHVVRGLARGGHSVRVLIRTAERAGAVPEGASGIVVGDLRKPASLGRALAGMEGVFLCTAMAQDETAQGLAAVRAAKEASVGKIVYMSVHNLESALNIPHFATKLPIERAIRESGIPYTIVRPNHFFQNDLWAQEAITRHGVYPDPIGSGGFSRVDARDIADIAIAALTLPGHDGITYPAAGPDVLNGEAVAEIWSRHLGRAVRYGGDDLEAWAAQVRGTMPEWMVHDLQIMFRHFQRDGMKATGAELALQAKALGHSPRRFEDFVAEVAPSWRARTAAS